MPRRQPLLWIVLSMLLKLLRYQEKLNTAFSSNVAMQEQSQIILCILQSQQKTLVCTQQSQKLTIRLF